MKRRGDGWYGGDAILEENMMTVKRTHVVHQAWFYHSWHEMKTRCGDVFAAGTRKLRPCVNQPVTCLLCINEINDAIDHENARG